jgi:hypothetical protein
MKMALAAISTATTIICYTIIFFKKVRQTTVIPIPPDLPERNRSAAMPGT